MSEVGKRLSAAGLRLPPVAAPVASYVPAVRTGNLIFSAGQIPRQHGELLFPGKVGSQVTQEQAQEASRLAALQAVAAVASLLDDVDQILWVVKVTVFVNSSPGFTGQSQVADGASEVLEMAFGNRGRHARSAVGVTELPLNSCVEVELLAEVAGT